MNRYLFALLISFLIMSCDQNSSQEEKEYIKNLEEKNKALEKELKKTESKGNSIKTAKSSIEKAKDYFTIGSTEDEVLEIMGTPTSYNDFGTFGKQFHYGLSTVFFSKGKVESYNNLDGNLKVRIEK